MSWFSWIWPKDKCPQCGVAPFTLPKNHPFTRACAIHDWEFDQAELGANPKTRAMVDSDLFWRWALIARNQTDPRRQCELMGDICKYWPLARSFGWMFWDGKNGSEDNEDTTEGERIKR